MLEEVNKITKELISEIYNETIDKNQIIEKLIAMQSKIQRELATKKKPSVVSYSENFGQYNSTNDIQDFLVNHKFKQQQTLENINSNIDVLSNEINFTYDKTESKDDEEEMFISPIHCDKYIQMKKTR